MDITDGMACSNLHASAYVPQRRRFYPGLNPPKYTFMPNLFFLSCSSSFPRHFVRMLLFTAQYRTGCFVHRPPCGASFCYSTRSISFSSSTVAAVLGSPYASKSVRASRPYFLAFFRS